MRTNLVWIFLVHTLLGVTVGAEEDIWGVEEIVSINDKAPAKRGHIQYSERNDGNGFHHTPKDYVRHRRYRVRNPSDKTAPRYIEPAAIDSRTQGVRFLKVLCCMLLYSFSAWIIDVYFNPLLYTHTY